MAFQYTFKLNGEALYATLGAMVSEKLEEPLDESNIHIPITVRDYEYKMLGLLEITATDGTITKNFTYLILSDRVKDISKSGFYSHDLTAVEYTVGLDWKLVHTLTFTEPFLQKTRAPFYFNFGESGSFRASFPEVELKANYFTNDYVTIGNIGTAILPTVGTIYDSNTVYARYRVNEGTWTTQVNVSTSSLAITFSTKGTYEIQIGLLGMLGDGIFYPAYTHYVKVFDEVRYTLYDMIQRIRNVIPLERSYYHEDTRLFDLDNGLVTRFQNIEMPQMFIQKQTLRQTLNTMFKYINAISRLHYMSESNDVLSIDEFNKITGTFDGANIISFESQQDAQQYGTKAISWLEQSLQSNFRENPSIKTPAQDLFKTVRSSDIQLTETSYEIKLEKPIYELSKFEVKIPTLQIEVERSTDTDTYTYTDVIIDITHRIIEKTWWNLKTITNDIFGYNELQPFDTDIGLRQNKNGNGFWTRNSNAINLNVIIGSVQKETLFINFINEAVNEEITLNSKTYITALDSLPISDPVVTILPSFITGQEFKVARNLSFNIEYVTLENPTLRVDRADISSINYDTDMRINQNSRFTDFGRMSRDAYGQLQRSAVPNHTLTKIHTSFDDIWDIGTIDSHGYIITKRHIAFYNEFIEVTYEATLDHNRLNEFNGINQEYRVFEIPKGNQAYERHDFYGDYVLITGPNVLFEEDVTVIKNTLTIPLLFERLIDVETDPTKITSAFVWTDGFSEVYPDGVDEYFALLTPVVSHGGKGGLVFTFGFDSNQVAGDALYEDSTNIYNEPIRYTNEQGFFDELWFGMINQYTPTDAFADLITGEDYLNVGHKYPLVKDSSGDFGQTFIMSLGDSRENYGTPILYDTLQVYKDSSESYKLSYQISILPYDYREFVIGQYFYTDNRLVRNKGDNDSKLYLYRYKDGTFYNKFDDLLVKVLDGSVENTDYDIVELVGNSNIHYNNMTLYFSTTAEITSAHTSWAIVDENGNLYLACNKPYNTTYIHIKHFRPNIILLGNKSYPASPLMFSGSASATITIIGESEGWKSTNYVGSASGVVTLTGSGEGVAVMMTVLEGSASGILTLTGSAAGYKPSDFIGSANGLLTLVGEAVGYKSTNYVGSASGVVTLTGSAEGVAVMMTVLEGSASGILTLTGSASGSIDLGTYTVTFKDYDGSVLKTVTNVPYDGYAAPPSNPTRTGYTFTGWNSSAYQVVTQNETITATYVANTYTVYFNANGGNTPNPTSKSVTYDALYGTLATTSRGSSHTFNGWFTASSGGTQVTNATQVKTALAHTLYARWSIKQYTITWRRYGTNGTNGTVTTNTVDYGTIVDAPNGTPDTAQYDYEWNEYRVAAYANETIYETRSLKYYTVTFEYNYDTPQTTQSVAYGGKATGFTPTRTGYTFGGWYTSSSLTTLYNFSTSVTTDRTLYAKWTANSVTVDWVAGGTAPTTYKTCKTINDVGNVRCDVTCSWEQSGDPYMSLTNVSTSPQCSGGQTRVSCKKSGPYWVCTPEEGTIIYTNCETCEVV